MDFTHRTGTTCVEPLCEAVGGWDTSKVTTMLGMFGSARRFNQPLDEWNTSAVTDMSYMFYYAVAFDQAHRA